MNAQRMNKCFDLGAKEMHNFVSLGGETFGFLISIDGKIKIFISRSHKVSWKGILLRGGDAKINRFLV